jgi:hypothetical protein
MMADSPFLALAEATGIGDALSLRTALSLVTTHNDTDIGDTLSVYADLPSSTGDIGANAHTYTIAAKFTACAADIFAEVFATNAISTADRFFRVTTGLGKTTGITAKVL